MVTTSEAASVPLTTTAGRARLGVVRVGGRSVVSRAYAASPLRLLTPTNHGHAAWVYSSSYGGGMVDGDWTSMHVDVGPGAAAYLSTQASTKIYRSPRGTRADLVAHIAADGLLVVVPDPVVCFAGSRYRQVQHVGLAERGGLVLVDWISSGRRAFGERWRFDEYASEIVVRTDARLLVHDAIALRAADGPLAERLGRFEVLALIVVAGSPLGLEAATILERAAALPASRRADLLVAAAPIGAGGCVLRMAGTSVEQVGRAIRDWLAFVPALLGDDPWTRKW